MNESPTEYLYDNASWRRSFGHINDFSVLSNPSNAQNGPIWDFVVRIRAQNLKLTLSLLNYVGHPKILFSKFLRCLNILEHIYNKIKKR